MIAVRCGLLVVMFVYRCALCDVLVCVVVVALLLMIVVVVRCGCCCLLLLCVVDCW